MQFVQIMIGTFIVSREASFRLKFDIMYFIYYTSVAISDWGNPNWGSAMYEICSLIKLSRLRRIISFRCERAIYS